MTGALDALAVLACLCLSVDLAAKVYLWRLRRNTKPAEPPAAPDLNAAQAVMADAWTRMFEVCEGRRNAMVAAGWDPQQAQACAVLMYLAMVQTVTNANP